MVGISHRIIIASESPLICEPFCSRLESNQGLAQSSDSNGSPASAGLAASFDTAGGLLKLGPLGKDVVINRNGYSELLAS